MKRNKTMLFTEAKSKIQAEFARDYTVTSLKLLIISWAVFVVVLTLLVDNASLLAAILAWEVLP
jgi:hypothetical protein